MSVGQTVRLYRYRSVYIEQGGLGVGLFDLAILSDEDRSDDKGEGDGGERKPSTGAHWDGVSRSVRVDPQVLRSPRMLVDQV